MLFLVLHFKGFEKNAIGKSRTLLSLARLLPLGIVPFSYKEIAKPIRVMLYYYSLFFFRCQVLEKYIQAYDYDQRNTDVDVILHCYFYIVHKFCPRLINKEPIR